MGLIEALVGIGIIGILFVVFFIIIFPVVLAILGIWALGEQLEGNFKQITQKRTQQKSRLDEF